MAQDSEPCSEYGVSLSVFERETCEVEVSGCFWRSFPGSKKRGRLYSGAEYEKIRMVDVALKILNKWVCFAVLWCWLVAVDGRLMVLHVEYTAVVT